MTYRQKSDARSWSFRITGLMPPIRTIMELFSHKSPLISTSGLLHFSIGPSLTNLLTIIIILIASAPHVHGVPRLAEIPAQYGPYPRIINGQPTSSEGYRSTVALYEAALTPSMSQLCGGTLVHEQYVMTAAHCVGAFLRNPQELGLMFDSFQLSTPTTTRRANGIIIHPDFDSRTLQNDVALVRFAEPVTTVPIARLLTTADADVIQENERLGIVGWGVTNPVTYDRPDFLQLAIVPIQSATRCAETLGSYFEPSSMFCAGRLSSLPDSLDGVDACYGDSGGPAFVQSPTGLRVGGIVSWGYECAGDKRYGVYTRVSKFASWVESLPSVPPINLVPPKIKGTMIVGKPSVCNPGQWMGDGEISLSYSWVDFDRGVTLAGPTKSPSYRPILSDAGHLISCVVEASSQHGTITSTSESPGWVQGAFNSKVTPHRNALVDRTGLYCRDSKCALFLRMRRDDVDSLSAIVTLEQSRCRVDCQRKTARVVAQNIDYKVWEIIFPRRRGWKATAKLAPRFFSDFQVSGGDTLFEAKAY